MYTGLNEDEEEEDEIEQYQLRRKWETRYFFDAVNQTEESYARVLDIQTRCIRRVAWPNLCLLTKRSQAHTQA